MRLQLNISSFIIFNSKSRHRAKFTLLRPLHFYKKKHIFKTPAFPGIQFSQPDFQISDKLN